jgi:hypothetical protein
MPAEPTTPAERAELLRLAKAATPRPWITVDTAKAQRAVIYPPSDEDAKHSLAVDPERKITDACELIPIGVLHECDSRFIVAAANLAPRLAADVDRLEKALGEERAKLCAAGAAKWTVGRTTQAQRARARRQLAAEGLIAAEEPTHD